MVKEIQNQFGNLLYRFLQLIQPTNYNFKHLQLSRDKYQKTQIQKLFIIYTNFLGQSDQTKVQFQTLSASVPQFQFKTIKKSFISWAPVKILAYFSNTICTQGSYKSLNNPVQVQFEEIVNQRSPQQSNAVQFQQSIFNLQDSEGLVSSIIPARTLSVNTNYTILSKFQDLSTKQEITAQLNIQIERSPLMIQIVGGSKIQNYLKAFQVLIWSKDPDLQTEWNQDPEIVLSVECIDLQHSNKPCIDQNNKMVHLNKTSNIQYIAARLFKPFTVLLFKVNCSKLNLKASTTAAIILLDADLPTINVSFPQGYKIRDVNINEKLKFQIMVDQNQKVSDMDFSFALVYNYETVFLKNIPNQMVEFAIWEGFQKFSFINQISVRFQAHDIKYLMPQIAAITLNVNMPPVSSIISILPLEGNALFTQFSFRVTNSKDKDSPLQYRYAYYESSKLYQKDILSGRQENLIILQDFTPVQTFQTLLESGNLTILLTVSDSLGSQVNFTQQIQSLDFYQQWQLINETNQSLNASSKCKETVSGLNISQGDAQLLIITSQELIKLLQNKIQLDCTKAINQQLQKIKLLLFEQLLNSANMILKSRISITLSKIYELDLGTTARQLSQNQSSLICQNTSNNQIQITQLAQIEQNYSDSEQVVNNISQIKLQVQKAIDQNYNLTSDYQMTFDIGDDQTARSLQQNIELRTSYIRILGSLFSNVHDQQIVISTMIDQLMNSFRSNLVLDTQGINVSTKGFGLQVSKIAQKKFQSFIINKQYDVEDLDLSNFVINRYIQLVKYKSNKYFYTEKFQETFKNGSLQLQKKETDKTIYEKSIIPYFESFMFDPQVFVDNINQVTQVIQLYQGKLAFNMGAKVDKCTSNDTASYDSTKQYKFVCSNYMDQQWVHDSCQIEQFTDKNGKIYFKCYCDKLYPLALMIMNISNQTKQQVPKEKPTLNIEEYLNLLIAENITIHAILIIFITLISLSALFKIKKQDINLYLIQERLDSKRQDEPIGITQQPRMSTFLFKANIKYLHEISRLIHVNYIYLSFTARIILASININLFLTLIHIFDVIIKNHIFSVLISISIQLIFQFVVKVLEGFFNGPQILKIFGYFFAISINFGIIALNLILNSSEQEYIIQIIEIIISLIILYGPLEIMIQYTKLTLAFTVSEQLKHKPFNPVTNLIYYFLQDEIVISLVQGATIY